MLVTYDPVLVILSVILGMLGAYTCFELTAKVINQGLSTHKGLLVGNGAPFDIFLAADESTPMQLESNRLAVDGTRFTYAYGRLVLLNIKASNNSKKSDPVLSGE